MALRAETAILAKGYSLGFLFLGLKHDTEKNRSLGGKLKMKIWDKLDEVLGALMLTSLAGMSMFLGYDGGVTQACITGIVALLVVSEMKTKSKEELEH